MASNHNKFDTSNSTMETPGAFHCRVCDISLATSGEFRQHAKSEWHIYKLQCRVASPGTVVVPPGQHDPQKSGEISAGRPAATDRDRSGSLNDDQGQSDGDDVEEEEPAPPFDPSSCLFCRHQSDTFEYNVAHMTTAHSFRVPYQDCLVVDLETLVWYLHLVIYGYRECILCATRRSTIEAIQQHMTAKGHCQFDISTDTEDFYELPESQYHDPLELVRPDEASLRLPSGKLLSHRTHREASTRPRASQQESSDGSRTLESGSGSSRGTRTDVVLRDEANSAILAARLSQLSARDQTTLAHLPLHEIRSVLATRRKQLDHARREEMKARRKVERLGNKTLMKHFKPDVPGRSNG